ncbi:hypothetical protein Palpr_2041 [Paludibacter propionicigenes WB4]|uniref:Aspartyl protease n=1 Tax=Paludibacter propionicigenes (strain DSM 17365 / JCM 13257 / WB4) TaxID=694427 RepID=E4T634_PALPW|nr:retropepsin-like aspartic protease [Paludibacter propionicigenes]ADQ80178.1 hypothetical protein Palpr_2041 [Paludibacter propionicigenes WB4]
MNNKNIIYILIILLFIVSCRHRSNREHLDERKIEREQVAPRETCHQKRNFDKSVVKMSQQDGVYHVPCKINGTEMEFIFDTGASNITMSLTEALFLYKQGKLKDEDFQGTQQYRIADGSIHEGMIVNLRKVEIGNLELNNVQASIVDNMDAPLLLGQSALAAFGKISIDYNRNEITFE